VAVGVNNHSDPVLRLEVGQPRPVGLSPVHGGGEVVDVDVAVLRGGLLSLLSRPHWALEAPLASKPPSQQVGVKAGELAWLQ